MQNREKNRKSSCSLGYMKSRHGLLFKHTGGFTLVELIVVIAILGILAGIGTVAYSGYIAHTNKEMDEQLVGNIERAIETGTYSYTFDLYTPIPIGSTDTATGLPVGALILSNGGITPIESAGASGAIETQSTCHLVTNTFVELESYTYESGGGCGSSGSSTAYYITGSEEITYCETHSAPAKVTRKIGTADGDTAPTDQEVYLLEDSRPYLSTDHQEGDVVTSSSYSGVFQEVARGDSALLAMVKAAYGEEAIDNLNLRYDWSNEWDAGMTFVGPTFYNGIVSTWGEIKELADLLMEMTDGESDTAFLGQTIMEDDHTSAADLVSDVATRIVAMGEEQFVQEWKTVDTSSDNASTYDNALFGMRSQNGKPSREYYGAVRKAYNTCFATYVTADASTDHDAAAHAAAISGFSKMVYMPNTICRSAFKNSSSGLASEVKNCEVCYQLYEEYVTSGMSETNARAFFQTMEAINDTGANVMRTEGGSDGYFDYYNNYLNELQGYYSRINSAISGSEENGGNRIVIVVFMNGDGKLDCDVYPKAADPRNSAE